MLDFDKALEEFEPVKKRYLEKFGEDSLERIDLWDPRGIANRPEEVYQAIDELERAIKRNEPLEQEDPEEYEQRIY